MKGTDGGEMVEREEEYTIVSKPKPNDALMTMALMIPYLPTTEESGNFVMHVKLPGKVFNILTTGDIRNATIVFGNENVCFFFFIYFF